MTEGTDVAIRDDIPASTIRLARALVNDSRRHGRREDALIQAVADLPLPDDDEVIAG